MERRPQHTKPSTDYDIEGEEMYDYIMTTAQKIQMLE